MSHAAPRPRQQTHSPNNHLLRSAHQRNTARATLGGGHPGTLGTILKGFQGGYLGQVFTRDPDADEIEFVSLSETETDLLSSLIARGGHDLTLFTNDEGSVMGAWLCDCPKCESSVLDFVRTTRIGLLAEAQRARSYRFDGNTVEIIIKHDGLATSWPPRQAFQPNWQG